MGAIFRNAQGLGLGLGRNAAAASGSLSGTLQIPGLLQDLALQMPVASIGLVTSIRVAGQQLLASSDGCDIRMFHPLALVEGQRALGIPLDANQIVEVDYASVAAAAAVGGWVGIDPIAKERVIPVNALGSRLDYAFGLGASGAIGAGGDGTVDATSRRDVFLGRMVLTPDTADVGTVRSVQVNNIELLSGQSGATDEIPIEVFSAFASDIDGLTLGYPINTNGAIVVSLHNYGAGALVVHGGIYCATPAIAE